MHKYVDDGFWIGIFCAPIFLGQKYLINQIHIIEKYWGIYIDVLENYGNSVLMTCNLCF